MNNASSLLTLNLIHCKRFHNSRKYKLHVTVTTRSVTTCKGLSAVEVPCIYTSIGKPADKITNQTAEATSFKTRATTSSLKDRLFL